MPWCRVYLPGLGWVEFDLTDGIVGNPALIRIGVARYRAATMVGRQILPKWTGRST